MTIDRGGWAWQRDRVPTVEITRSSRLLAGPSEVWPVITTFAGVNAELMPLVRMREPKSVRGRTLESYRPGERAACWILLGGVVPFDRHLLGLESITDGVGFVEESTTWVQRRWRHERTIEPDGTGTSLTDHLTIEPRLGFAAPVVRTIVGVVFRHRHRRLAERFGTASG